MNESDPPNAPDPLHQLGELRESIAELATHVQRLARAVESSNRQTADSSPPYRVIKPEMQLPSIHVPQYAPPEPPATRSMVDRLREKRITLPAATGWGVLAWLAIEIGQAMLAGKIKLW